MPRREGDAKLARVAGVWRNWMGNQSCAPREIFRPTTLADLQFVVRTAAEEGRKVRAFGSGHSWMPLVPTDDFLVDVRGLNRLLEVDTAAGTITVEGGMTLGELTAHAQQAGLAIQSPTVANGFTVAGMVATGSAGTGNNVRTFPDSVVRMVIVKADGEVVELDESDPDMPFARVAFGSLGLIYSVTLHCPPARNLRCETRKVPVAEMIGQIEHLTTHHDAVMLMWYPYTKNAIVMLYDATDDPVTFGPWKHRWMVIRQWIIEGVIGRPALSLMVRVAPRLMMWPMRLASALTPASTYVETQRDGVHWQFVYPAVWDSAWAVPIEDAGAAWQAWMDELDEFASRKVYPITMVMFARFLQGSTSPLSPDFGRRSCYVEATSLKATPGVLDFYRRIEDVMLTRFDGRPHWAKVFTDYDRVRAQYGDRIAQAAEVRKRWDPDGRFMNRFVERILTDDPEP